MPNDDEMYHLRDAVVARVALVMNRNLVLNMFGVRRSYWLIKLIR